MYHTSNCNQKDMMFFQEPVVLSCAPEAGTWFQGADEHNTENQRIIRADGWPASGYQDKDFSASVI